MLHALLRTGRLSDFCGNAAWIWIQTLEEPNLVNHFCLLYFIFYCTNHNFLLQIQRLLEAQARQACSSEQAAASRALQPEKQGDLVSMETQSSPGSQMRKSVSIAVSTGNTLFFKNRLASLFLDVSVIWLGMEGMFCRNAERMQTRTRYKHQLSSLGVICKLRLELLVSLGCNGSDCHHWKNYFSNSFSNVFYFKLCLLKEKIHFFFY